MISFIKQTCLQSTKDLHLQLSTLHSQAVGNEYNDVSTPNRSPDNKSNIYRKTPMSVVSVKSTPGSQLISENQTVNKNSTFDVLKIKSTSDILRSAISTITQPSLRKLIMAADGSFIISLSKLLDILPIIRMISTKDLEDCVSDVEKSCFNCLETLSQVDISEDIVSFKRNQSNFHYNYQFLMPNKNDCLVYLEALIFYLLPSLTGLISHPVGDLRVIVSSTMRRIFPTTLRAFLLLESEESVNSVFDTFQQSLISLFTYMKNMLKDQSPIPQYTVRLLVEMITISPSLAPFIAKYFLDSDTFQAVSNLLEIPGDSDSEVDSSGTVDPQVAILLTSVFEHNTDPSNVLDSELSTLLASSITSVLFLQNNSKELNIEIITPLIDLLHCILNFVINSLSVLEERKDNQPQSPSSSSKYNLAEQRRRAVAPLRSVCPAILLIFVKVMNSIEEYVSMRTTEDDDDDFDVENDSMLTSFMYVMDVSSRCLGILFDLFPDAVTNVLLSKQSLPQITKGFKL